MGLERSQGWRGWRLPLNLRLPRGSHPAPGPEAPGSDTSVVDCAVYRNGLREDRRLGYAQAYEEVRQITAAAHDPDAAFVWLGLLEPTEAAMADVARVFGLHELAVEDALTANHRAKIERYGDVAFFVLRTTGYVEHADFTETSEVVETGAVMMFIGPQFVITVRHGAPGALQPVRAALEAKRSRLALGPWAVAHAICDRLVDTYLDVSNLIEADVDLVEERVFGREAANPGIAQIYQLKRELMEFKRAVLPLQRPLAFLSEEKELFPKELRNYFRDVNDNLARIADRVAGLDDLLNSILQSRLAQVSIDQNNDMRKIAAWAAIAAMQTAIAGIYGMNFDNMPELHWRYSYAGVWVIMLAGGAGLYTLFRRSGWL
ncbi:magnesium and cobalt transport protein CorA [Hamadaea tsunoensis]|uniref:magnesium and cobalt transport protein CorA n=1 Tax=Hamadaea tsunoensis TaxID=53368 RepID=UPI000555038C|nr:magnesium and cobalt transport protein CorA [Hamadaea tsunoensis]